MIELLAYNVLALVGFIAVLSAASFAIVTVGTAPLLAQGDK